MEELDDICCLALNPLTAEEKAKRFSPECAYMLEQDFERWTIGQRRVRYYQSLLEKHLQQGHETKT
jgi:hypothetical protein